MLKFEFKEKNKMWKNQRHTNKIGFEEKKKPVDVECTSFFNYVFVLLLFSLLEMSKDIYIDRGFLYTYTLLPRSATKYISLSHGSISKSIHILCVQQRFLSSKFCSFLVISSIFFSFLFVRFLSFFHNPKYSKPFVHFLNSVITLAGFVFVYASSLVLTNLFICIKCLNSKTGAKKHLKISKSSHLLSLDLFVLAPAAAGG